MIHLLSSICQTVPARHKFQSTAPLQVSGMKMRNLLLGVFLGLLAVVHSASVDTLTQIPAKAEDDVFREAVTDGYLIDRPFLPLLTTESPKRNTTVQASQQPSFDYENDDVIEDNTAGETDDESTATVFLQHGSEHYATTTLNTQSSASTVLPRDTDDSSSDSSTTQSPQSSVTPDHISVSQTSDPAVSSFDFLTTPSSDFGSGDGEMLGHSTTSPRMTSSSNTEISTASSTSTTAPQLFAGGEGSGLGSELGTGLPEEIPETTVFPESEGSGMWGDISVPVVFPESKGPGLRSESGSESEENTVSSNSETRSSLIKEPPINLPAQGKVENPNTASPQSKGHTTPGWIIIVGFIVGVAALVMLFVAIATRDKWNGPSQASQLETKANSSNQQRELEMETFLHKDNPKENGKAAEYTVIPLDELPEKYSSH